MNKTNAVRLCEQAGLHVRTAEYSYDENDLSGLHVPAQIGMDPEQVFKTLVLRGASSSLYVFCIPVCDELDLKKAARAAGEKSIAMLHVKELFPNTGYIRGGCSPIGMKKKYPTFIDETAILFDEVAFSAGMRGQQLILPPDELIDFTDALPGDYTT